MDEATQLTTDDVDLNTRIYAQITNPLREQVFENWSNIPRSSRSHSAPEARKLFASHRVV